MKWDKVNEINHADNALCPTCQEKTLQRKLEKIQLLNEYQQIENYIKLLEEIKQELYRIKKEKETQLYVLLCKKHKNNSTNIF